MTREALRKSGDRTACGRAIKCLVLVGDATHDVAIELEGANYGHGVVRVLARLRWAD